jgi:hypothetical protein
VAVPRELPPFDDEPDERLLDDEPPDLPLVLRELPPDDEPPDLLPPELDRLPPRLDEPSPELAVARLLPPLLRDEDLDPDDDLDPEDLDPDDLDPEPLELLRDPPDDEPERLPALFDAPDERPRDVRDSSSLSSSPRRTSLLKRSRSPPPWLMSRCRKASSLSSNFWNHSSHSIRSRLPSPE